MFKSDFINIISERGFINQCTDLEKLDLWLENKNRNAYIGFDATADSLHVGHLVSLMAMRWFKKTGNNPLMLIGGGTSLVGDPSFRNTSRPILTSEEISKNINQIKESSQLIIKDMEIQNNNDWLKNINLLDFLRDIGSQFTISKMVSFESVKNRLNDGLTFMEFTYMLLQAFDFFELSKKRDCFIQMGGSDQWGNIINGIELIRRKNEKEAFGLTFPLLSTADGQKMGKTANGAVWLSKAKLSNFEFWQFWRNINDKDINKFLLLFTELPIKEINKLSKLSGQDCNIAKEILANEVTKIVRGQEAINKISKILKNDISDKNLDKRILKFEKDTINIIDVIIELKVLNSKSEIRRFMKNGGIRLNNEKVFDENIILEKNKDLMLSFGTKNKIAIKLI